MSTGPTTDLGDKPLTEVGFKQLQGQPPPAGQSDVSNQPLTEDGFHQLVAQATNVPSKGGPDPSKLMATFGYIGDATPDHASLQGLGAYTHGEKMTPLYSAALSKPAQEKHNVKPGQTFTSWVDGKTYRLDDTNDSTGQADVVDVYNPNHPPDPGHENDANRVIAGKTEAEWFKPGSGGPSESAAPRATTTTAPAPKKPGQTQRPEEQPEETKLDEEPKPQAQAQPQEEKQPPSDQEENIYTPFGQEGNVYTPYTTPTPQQQSSQSKQKREAGDEEEKMSPVLKEILDKIYTRYG